MVIRAFQDMAVSSSPTSTNHLPAQTVSEKLTKLNHALWHAQVRAAICGTLLKIKFGKAEKTGCSDFLFQIVWFRQFQVKTKEGAKLEDLRFQDV
jgi:hypothetical protein